MKYQLANHVSFTEVDDEAVLLDLNSGAYFGLNHVGALLLTHLQNKQSIEFAQQQIAAKYQISDTIVEQDIEALLAQLLEQKLIVDYADGE